MSDDSAVEAASNWAQAHVDGRLALTQDQITAIARALLASQSQVERMREALATLVSYHDRLNGMSVDELLIGDGTSEYELIAKARAALTPEEEK